MRAMVVVPEGYSVKGLGENITIKEKPQGRAIAFDFLPPHGAFLVIPQPESVHDIPTLVEAACALASTHQAIAFLPETEPQRNVLATAAAAYAFDALTLHLAGGLDSTIPIDQMCLDAMIRLAGRGSQPIALGHSSVTSIPSLDVDSYLKVATRNFTPETQARYLAPVFLATVTAPLYATHTDTSILDLERTAYTPSAEHTPRELPEGSNDGVHTVHEWFSGLTNNTIAYNVLKPFRRRPDELLPNIDEFFGEAVGATGIEDDIADILSNAFAEIAENPVPHVLFVVGNDSQAHTRMEAIRACLPYEVAYFDAETRKFYIKCHPEEQWRETDERKMRECPIVYLIDVHLRTLPWLNISDAIVIVDFTCTDIVDSLRYDVLMETTNAPSPGYQAMVLNETLARADRLIARDISQRDFLLGIVAGLRRLNQYTYDEDLSLSSLVDTETDTQAARDAIEICLHPFDAITSSAEYEQTLFDAAVPVLPSLPRRAVGKAKRAIFREEC